MGYSIHPSLTSIPVHKVRALIGRSIIQKQDPHFDFYREPEDITPTSLKAVSLSTIFLYETLACYHGYIDFDSWLNHQGTTWRRARIIRNMLTKRGMPRHEYFQCIGIEDTPAVRGQMVGKIDAMGAICLIRELYHKSKYDTNDYPEISYRHHLMLLNQYLHLTTDYNDLFLTLKRDMSLFHTQDHLQISLLAKYFTPCQAMYAKCEFKRRVSETMLKKFIHLLRQKNIETEYKVHYCLGFLTRLYGLDLANPYWTNYRCYQTLQDILQLYQKTLEWDAGFITDTFPTVISKFLQRRPFHIYPLYVWYVFRLIYHSAIEGASELDMLARLVALQSELNITLNIDRDSFSQVYSYLPNHDLQWAHEELEKVVKVTPTNQ